MSHLNPYLPLSPEREILCQAMSALRSRLHELPPIREVLPVEETSGLEWLLHGLREETNPSQQKPYLLDIAASALRLHMYLTTREKNHAL